MSQHNRPAGLRGSLARIAIAGAATLATIAATAHVAVADDATPPDETTDTPSTTTGDAPSTGEELEPTGDPTTDPPEPDSPESTGTPSTPEAAPKSAAPAEASVENGEVEPDYGIQKFRVGVQIADGAYAPDANTAGSVIQVTIFDEDGDVEDVFTCETDESTAEGTATFCLESDAEYDMGTARSATTEAGPIPGDQAFLLFEGESASATQVSATTGLIKSTATATVEPCLWEVDNIPFCADDQTMMFNDFGPPPVADNDSVTATSGEPITIEILSNDADGNGAPTDIEIATSPDNGDAVVGGDAGVSPASTSSAESGVAYVTTALANSSTSNAALATAVNGSQFITYTSTAGYTGKDTFTYRITTPNGSDTATVTVTILSADGVLPDTGSPDNGLLAYAALLLGGGGWLVARGRRESWDALVPLGRRRSKWDTLVG